MTLPPPPHKHHSRYLWLNQGQRERSLRPPTFAPAISSTARIIRAARGRDAINHFRQPLLPSRIIRAADAPLLGVTYAAQKS
jgi:hypothetical protein